MSKPKLSMKSRTAYAGDGVFSAWWYENEKSIDVFVQLQPERRTGHVRITRHQIKSWLKKLESK